MLDQDFEDLLNVDPVDWLNTLPPYQRDPFDALLKDLPPEEVAHKWLATTFAETSSYGGTGATLDKRYITKLKEELAAFICGHEKYKQDRNQLAKQLKQGKQFIVSAISVAIAPHVGTSAVFIGPAIVLLLCAAGKVSTRAWCESMCAAKTK